MICVAEGKDLKRLTEFLTSAGLGTDGLSEEKMDSFLLLEGPGGRLTGSLGMEVFEQFGLLRSLVVSAGQGQKEIFLLFDQMMQLAKKKGVRELYLATNRQESLPFFNLLGFAQTSREDLPSEFYQSEHIQHILNVDNSLFLKFTL